MTEDEASHGIYMDPAVAALLEPLRAEASKQEHHTRIAHIRLRQEHVRGNATYAAKILEQAIRDTNQDRKAYELLAARLEALELAVARLPADANLENKNVSDTPSKNSNATTKGEATTSDESSQKDGKQVDSKQDSTKLSDDQIRIQEMERWLEERLELEILHCKEDQTTLREQEQRLRGRIQSLQKSIQQQTPGNSKSRRRLEESVAGLHEYTTTAGNHHVECIVCRDRAAVRAVIPCGHLCLCDECTPTLVDSSIVVPCCPMCRGSLLSTLKIYAVK